MRTDPDVYSTFALALELRMTVSELRQRMSGAEFCHWLAFFEERGRREARAMKKRGGARSR